MPAADGALDETARCRRKRKRPLRRVLVPGEVVRYLDLEAMEPRWIRVLTKLVAQRRRERDQRVELIPFVPIRLVSVVLVRLRPEHQQAASALSEEGLTIGRNETVRSYRRGQVVGKRI